MSEKEESGTRSIAERMLSPHALAHQVEMFFTDSLASWRKFGG